jgi:hypothetical protein
MVDAAWIPTLSHMPLRPWCVAIQYFIQRAREADVHLFGLSETSLDYLPHYVHADCISAHQLSRYV